MDLRLTTIATFLTPEDAEVARLALEEEGISTSMEGATAVGMVWLWSNAVGGVKLQVPEADEARAREILARKAGIAEAAEATRRCPKCGAEVPSNFEVCWSCQFLMSGDEEPANQLPSESSLPTKEDSSEDDVEEVAPDDPMAWDAFLTAMVGVPLVPPLLHLYSAWLLARIVYRGFRLSRAGREYFWLSALLDSVVFLFVGWLLGWGKAGFVWGW
jgi:hypothetical protein